MNDPIIQLKDVSVTFGSGRNAFRAVKNVSFELLKGLNIYSPFFVSHINTPLPFIIRLGTSPYFSNINSG